MARYFMRLRDSDEEMLDHAHYASTGSGAA